MGRPTGISNRGGRCSIRFYVHGKQRQEQTDFPYSKAGVKDAERYRQQRIRYLNAQDPLESIQVPDFGTVAQAWLDSADLTPTGRRTTTGALNRYWMPIFDKIPIDQITYLHLDDVVSHFKQRLKPSTTKRVIAAAAAVFSYAVRAGYTSAAPTAGFRYQIKDTSKVIDPFTRDERDAILGELEGNAKIFFAIRFYTGMRPGEVLALTWDDYDGDAFAVRKQVIEGKKLDSTKTGKSRKVFAPPYIRKVLRETPSRFRGGHIVQTREGDHYYSSRDLGDLFREAVKRLGIRPRSSYNCRHTCATMMLESGAEPSYCATQLGHTLQVFFKHYATWINPDRDAEERRKVEEYL